MQRNESEMFEAYFLQSRFATSYKSKYHKQSMEEQGPTQLKRIKKEAKHRLSNSFREVR